MNDPSKCEYSVSPLLSVYTTWADLAAAREAVFQSILRSAGVSAELFRGEGNYAIATNRGDTGATSAVQVAMLPGRR